MRTFAGWALTIAISVLNLLPAAAAESADKPAVKFQRDDAAGKLEILIADQPVLVYQYGAALDMAHYYPVFSPSHAEMTIQQTDPYPHHRSFWFADRVQLDGGRDVNFYGAMYTRSDPKDPQSPLRDRIRHVEFVKLEDGTGSGLIEAKLVWEMDQGEKPVLDELRRLRVVALGQGEYLLDLTYTLTAAHGNVKFTSDAAHYAWPYVRMNKAFSVEGAQGKMVNSEGGTNQAGTNAKEAHWVDYSAKVNGAAEGLAIFSHPDNGYPHLWLTRDYGTFGPRRVEAKNGKPFDLAKGESLTQRIGVLVHRGDVQSGQVAERYQQYVAGSAGQ